MKMLQRFLAATVIFGTSPFLVACKDQTPDKIEACLVNKNEPFSSIKLFDQNTKIEVTVSEGSYLIDFRNNADVFQKTHSEKKKSTIFMPIMAGDIVIQIPLPQTTLSRIVDQETSFNQMNDAQKQHVKNIRDCALPYFSAPR